MWMMYTDSPARGGGDGGGLVVESEESDAHRTVGCVFASPALIDSVTLGVRSGGCNSRALISLELYRGWVLCAEIDSRMQSPPIHEFAGTWGTGRLVRGLTCSLPSSAESESFRFRLLLLERRRPSAC